MIDFGIAKATRYRLTDKTLFTAFHQIMGTPTYMSPEQAEMSGLEVDTRSDIYSLGVLLYELLTGTTPFDAQALYSAAFGEMQRIIRDVDPPRPSARLTTLRGLLTAVASSRGAEPRKLCLSVRGELDWIVMKAMEKNRARRYESAGELARDVGHHLDNEPVDACPPSAGYRLRKFASRHRGAVVAAAAAALVGLAAAAVYVQGIRVEQRKTEVALREARAERAVAVRSTDRAVAAEAAADEQWVGAVLAQARGSQTSLAPGRRFDSWAALAAVAKVRPSAAVRSQAIGCLALADLRPAGTWDSAGRGLRLNHACTACADWDADGSVRLDGDPGGDRSGSPPVRLPGPDQGVQVRFSADDRLVAVSGGDDYVRVYPADGTTVREFPGGPACDFTPDGTAIATGPLAGPVVLYDLRSGKSRNHFDWAARKMMAFSPDGRKLAMWNADDGRWVDVGDLSTGKVVSRPRAFPVVSVAWHPDSTRLAVGTGGGGENLFIWTPGASGPAQPMMVLHGHLGRVTDVAFAHGGDLLASSSWDATVRLWDAVSGQPLVRAFQYGESIAFSPDDSRLCVVQGNGRHARYDVATGRVRRTLQLPGGEVFREVSFSPDGLVLAWSGGRTVRFWNLGAFPPDGLPVDLPFPDEVRSAAFDPGGGGLFAITNSGLCRVPIRDHAGPPGRDGSAARQRQIGPDVTPLLDLPTRGDGCLRVSGDSRRVAIAENGLKPRLVDLDARARQTVFKSAPLQTSYVSLSSDGKWVATGVWRAADADGPCATVWNARTGERACDLPTHLATAVAFSPDARWLVTCTGREYRFWQVGTWRPAHAIPRTADAPARIIFAPDSSLMAISPGPRGLELVDPQTGGELATFDDRGEGLPVGFSPDGGQLVAACADDTLRVWDVRRVRRELAGIGLDWPGPTPAPRPAADPVELSLVPAR